MKRRKISEIYSEMDEINKRKPTEEELGELAEVLNETEGNGDENQDFPFDQIARGDNINYWEKEDE